MGGSEEAGAEGPARGGGEGGQDVRTAPPGHLHRGSRCHKVNSVTFHGRLSAALPCGVQ